MRIGSAFMGLAIALASCGGKVVYEGGAGGGGVGGGSSSASVLPTTGSSTSTGVSCVGVGCGQGSDGSCSCDGICNMQSVEVQCSPIPGGVACACLVNGNLVGKCQQVAENACDFFAGCCAASFFGP